MKKDEAISILATSQRPREPKDRARYDEAVKMAIDALNKPERKTGHWVYRPEWSNYGDVWSCSECGEKTSQSVMGKPRFKYCPMCDAKMESVGEQE